MRQSPSYALHESASDADSALPTDKLHSQSPLCNTSTRSESGAHAPDWETSTRPRPHRRSSSVRNPLSSTHAGPATSRSSDRGRGGKGSQGQIQHAPILSLLLLLITSTKRPRRMSSMLNLSNTDLHINWGDAATKRRRCLHKWQYRWASAGFTLSRHILRR